MSDTIVTTGYLVRWYGGANYALGDKFEWVPTIAQAKEYFESRAKNDARWASIPAMKTADITDGIVTVSDPDNAWELETPCVEDSEMFLYPVQPGAEEWDYDYPSHIIEQGPRGGTRVTQA